MTDMGKRGIEFNRETISFFILAVFAYENDPKMDKRPCASCGKIPPVYIVNDLSRRNLLYPHINRKTRVDFIDDNGKEKTLCKKCWLAQFLDRDDDDGEGW